MKTRSTAAALLVLFALAACSGDTRNVTIGTDDFAGVFSVARSWAARRCSAATRTMPVPRSAAGVSTTLAP